MWSVIWILRAWKCRQVVEICWDGTCWRRYAHERCLLDTTTVTYRRARVVVIEESFRLTGWRFFCPSEQATSSPCQRSVKFMMANSFLVLTWQEVIEGSLCRSRHPHLATQSLCGWYGGYSHCRLPPLHQCAREGVVLFDLVSLTAMDADGPARL